MGFLNGVDFEVLPLTCTNKMSILKDRETRVIMANEEKLEITKDGFYEITVCA